METKTKNKDSVITQINQGDHGVNVAGDFKVVVNLLCEQYVLKKSEQDNASDMLIKNDENIVTKRELKLRTDSSAFIMWVTFCIFAFIYPYWWSDSYIYPLILSVSWAIAGSALTLMFVILKNRKIVENMIYKNIERNQKLRLLKELV